MSSRTRIVVFDLGGVMVRICRSLAEACGAAGVPFIPDTIAAEQVAARRTLREAYETGRIGCDEFFAGIERTTGGAYTSDQFRRIHDAWLLGEYPGIDRVLDAVHASGLASGVLSNTNHAHWRSLRTYPTVSRVRHLHASHLLGCAKPDATIFRRFESETGFDAPEILFFDDLPENVAGAAAAGWDAVRIDHAGDTPAQMMDTLRARGLAH